MYSSSTNVTNAKPTFKVVVVGEKGVGKTSFLNKLFQGNFAKTFALTIGIE